MASLLLLCLLLPGLVRAGEPEARTPVMAGFDGRDTGRSWESSAFFASMQERTGLRFAFRQYPDAASWAAAKAAFARGGEDLPDVLFKAALSPAESLELLEKGVLIDLSPLLPLHCPNLTRLLSEYPEARAAITLPGGAIAALPFLSPLPAQNCLWINRKWLDTLGLSMPETAEELTRVLEAFREGDPNRNGRRDEVPLLLQGAYELKYLSQAFGVVANDFNVYEEGGRARFLAEHPGFFDFLSWCRDLYARELLDRDSFGPGASLRRVSEARGTPRYGVFMAPLPGHLLPAEWSADYEVIPPLAWEGKRLWRPIAGRTTPGAFAVTAACEDPGAVLAWVDCLYSPEGAALSAAGEEGRDYVFDGDGTWRGTQLAASPSFLSEVSILTGAAPPGLAPDDFQRRAADPEVRRLSAQIDRVGAVAADPFPPFSLTRAREAEVAPLQAAIGRLLDEGIAGFVTGERELNAQTWEDFKQQLGALGLERFLEFWQQVLDDAKER